MEERMDGGDGWEEGYGALAEPNANRLGASCLLACLMVGFTKVRLATMPQFCLSTSRLTGMLGKSYLEKTFTTNSLRLRY